MLFELEAVPSLPVMFNPKFVSAGGGSQNKSGRTGNRAFGCFWYTGNGFDLRSVKARVHMYDMLLVHISR